MTYICTLCHHKFKDIEAFTKHTIGECHIPKNKREYWNGIIKLALEDIIQEVSRKTLLHPKNLTIEELRGLYILQAMNLIKVKHLPDSESMQVILATHAPEAIISMMEYAGLIQVNEDGTVSQFKEKDE